MHAGYFRLRAISLSLILTAAMAISCAMAPTAYAQEPDEVIADAAILVEETSGEVLYEQDADKVLFPASTTKILTALLAVEAIERGDISLDDEVEVSETALEDIIWDASHVSPRLKKFEIMTVRDYLYCAMLDSDCASCNVLAECVSGSREAFVKLMNSRASELGCVDTNFTNPSGYPDERLYTTARSIYLIASEAMKHPLFADIVSTTEYTVPQTNLTRARQVYTTNRLLKKDDQDYYKYAVGIKTGTTDAAGSCLVSCARKGDMTLICVVMGSYSVINKEDKSVQRYAFSESARMLKWGFKNYGYITVLGRDETAASIPVTRGSADSMPLRPSEDIVCMLPRDYDTQEIERRVELYADSAEAPIAEGAALGRITLLREGEEIGSCELLAGENVAQDMYHQILMEFGLSDEAAIVYEINIAALVIGSLIIIIRRRRKTAY